MSFESGLASMRDMSVCRGGRFTAALNRSIVMKSNGMKAIKRCTAGTGKKNRIMR